MGLTGSTTPRCSFDDVRVPAERRLGEEGDGLKIALAGLDSGRLGIAAVATGLAQGALDAAVAYAQERETFGKRIIDHQGLAFMLADMEATVQAARAITLHAARLRDQRPAVQPRGLDRQAGRHRQRHEGHHRRRPGARRLRLHPRLPGRALHARGQGDADLRGHQPDPADGDRPRPRQGHARGTVTPQEQGELMQLDNTAAIVTGGASGLGAATAAALADKGVPGLRPRPAARSTTRPAVDG